MFLKSLPITALQMPLCGVIFKNFFFLKVMLFMLHNI